MSTFHYIPKKISEVSPKDSRVAITGNVIESGEGFFVLDDETGKIEIGTDVRRERGRIVRAFCSVADEKLRADAVQEMDGIDIDLLKKINSLYNSVV